MREERRGEERRGKRRRGETREEERREEESKNRRGDSNEEGHTHPMRFEKTEHSPARTQYGHATPGDESMSRWAAEQGKHRTNEAKTKGVRESMFTHNVLIIRERERVCVCVNAQITAAISELPKRCDARASTAHTNNSSSTNFSWRCNANRGGTGQNTHSERCCYVRVCMCYVTRVCVLKVCRLVMVRVLCVWLVCSERERERERKKEREKERKRERTSDKRGKESEQQDVTKSADPPHLISLKWHR